ncbi:VOC family protein [Paenibacillus cremeus]|uniref:Glyoxalase n=1 Tax=Paenibacillus cremeus TaxID=2163881 RepID=A0A559K8B4_9BACL|nr:VOC family protein [Paenibacillus cremeus]TVY08376.1 glyoxalase [Paenibacillus cremeus]
MLQCKKYHHVSISVTNLERSVAFYKHVLGLQEIPRPPIQTSRGVWLDVGGQQLHLIVHDGETIRKGVLDTKDGHLAIVVENYQETIDWLEANGIEYEARPHAVTGFSQIYITDPDKNIIELDCDFRD